MRDSLLLSRRGLSEPLNGFQPSGKSGRVIGLRFRRRLFAEGYALGIGGALSPPSKPPGDPKLPLMGVGLRVLFRIPPCRRQKALAS